MKEYFAELDFLPVSYTAFSKARESDYADKISIVRNDEYFVLELLYKNSEVYKIKYDIRNKILSKSYIFKNGKETIKKLI